MLIVASSALVIFLAMMITPILYTVFHGAVSSDKASIHNNRMDE